MKTIEFDALYHKVIDRRIMKTMKQRAGWWVIRRVVDLINFADDCSSSIAPFVLEIAELVYGEKVSVDFGPYVIVPKTEEDEPDEQ